MTMQSTVVPNATPKFKTGTLSLKSGARKKTEQTSLNGQQITTKPRRPTGSPSNAAKQDMGNTAASPTPPPIALVKTWMWMADSGNTPEVKRIGKSNLESNFGSVSGAKAYIATR